MNKSRVVKSLQDKTNWSPDNIEQLISNTDPWKIITFIADQNNDYSNTDIHNFYEVFCENQTKIQTQNTHINIDDYKVDAHKYLNIPKVGIECPKCKEKNVHYHTVQDRSGDEGMTAYLNCKTRTCQYSWVMRV